jgi:hypothetical protein
VQAVSAERGEHQDPGVQQVLRNLEHLHPDPDQRQVEDQQDHVADVEARDQAPHQLGLRLKEERAGLDAVVLECAQQDRRRGGGGNAERQERDQHAGRRSVIRRLGPGDALDSALAELVGMLG